MMLTYLRQQLLKQLQPLTFMATILPFNETICLHDCSILLGFMMQHCQEMFFEENGKPPSDEIDIQLLPPAMTGAFFMCDGQPAAQLSAMIAADNNKYYTGNVDVHLPDYSPDNSRCTSWRFSYGPCNNVENNASRFNGKFFAFPGGFHAGMKLHNCCGMLFGNFLIVFFGARRNMLPKILYILYPNDPRQLQKELPQYILVHYRSAFLFCWETRQKKDDDIPTPVEVHKYMIDRAENSPLCQGN
ncbi:hypothetical protein ACHAXN_009686 [Cyclotella atomus]